MWAARVDRPWFSVMGGVAFVYCEFIARFGTPVGGETEGEPDAKCGRAGGRRFGEGHAPRMRAMASTTSSSKAALSLIMRPNS